MPDMENQQQIENACSDEMEISLYDIFMAVLRRWVMIAFFVVIAIGLAIGYLFIADPVYESTATVMISSLAPAEEVTLTGLMQSGRGDISMEVQLLNSRTMIQDALDSLDLSRYLDEDGVPYSQQARPLTAQRLLESGAISIEKSSGTNIVSITVKDTNAGFACDLANALALMADDVLTGVAKDSSKTSIEFVDSQIPIVQKSYEEASSALADFQKENAVLQVSQQSMIALSRYDYLVARRAPLELEAREADAILASYSGSASYDDLLLVDGMQDLMEDIEAVQEEMLGYDLIVATPAVVSYRPMTGMTGVPAAMSGTSDGETAQGHGMLMSAAAPATSSTTLTPAQSSRYDSLSASLEEMESRMADLVLSSLDGMTGQAASGYAQAVVQKALSESEIALIDRMCTQESAALDEIPELERQLSTLYTDVQVYQSMVVSLMNMRQEAQLRDAAIQDSATIVDQALVSEDPVSPSALMILAVAIVLGGFIGVALALVLELSDSTIFTMDDLKKAQPRGVPFLGWIPMLRDGVDERCLVVRNPSCYASEKYRLMASSILYAAHGGGRAIAVTSCDDGTSRTHVTMNLALAMAGSGARVLVVDGDLLNPVCAKYFDLDPASPGYVDAIADGKDVHGCIVHPLSEVDALDVLPCGDCIQAPARVFSSQAFRDMLNDLKRTYDIILLPAAGAALASDMLALAGVAGDALVVVRAGVGDRNGVAEMAAHLESVSASIIGTCLYDIVVSQVRGAKVAGTSDASSLVMHLPLFGSRKSFYRKRYRRG